MRTIVLIISFLLVGTSFQATYKINSYNISLKFDDSQKLLNINALVSLQHEQTKNIELLLSSNCTISSITASNGKYVQNIEYALKSKDTIILTLDETVLKDSILEIMFNYCYPTGEDTLILVDRGHRWYPMIAENIVLFTMLVEFPKNYIAVSAGELLIDSDKGSKQYTFKSNVPVFKIPLIIAPVNYYSANRTHCGNVATTIYYLPNNNAGTIDSIQTDICNHINYFSAKFGNYPFNSFTIVETPAFEGANLGSSIITAGSANIKGTSLGYFEWLDLAVATQWVGVGVFPKLFCKGFWFLSLSLPHYLRLMYVKDIKGEDVFNKELEELSKKYDSFAGTEKDMPIIDVDFPNTKEKGILIYAKGVLVLHELKKQMGEPNWTDMLKYLHENYYGKIILMDDFIDCINKFDTTGECSEYLTKMLGEKGSLN